MSPGARMIPGPSTYVGTCTSQARNPAASSTASKSHKQVMMGQEIRRGTTSFSLPRLYAVKALWRNIVCSDTTITFLIQPNCPNIDYNKYFWILLIYINKHSAPTREANYSRAWLKNSQNVILMVSI